MDQSAWTRGIGIGGLALLGVLALLYALPARGEVALEGLTQADPVARAQAIEDLARTADMDDLLYALGHEEDPLVLSGIAEAIRRQGVTSAEKDDLVALLSAEEIPTRHLAAVLLEPVASSVWTSLRDVAANEEENLLVRAAATRALGSAGAQARGPLGLLARATTEPQTLRHAAITSLASTGPDGVSDVQKIAADTGRPAADRTAAVRSLTGSTVDGESALVGLCGSRDAFVREAAAYALQARGATGAGTTLASMLTDRDGRVRYAALQAIHGLGLAKTNRTAVVARLMDLDPKITALAARVAGAVGGSIKATLIPTLKGLLASTSFRVRYEAALALNQLGDKSGSLTMLADKASPNPSQAQMATEAFAQITGA